MIINKISHKGFNEKVLTFYTDGTIAPGALVKLDSNGKVIKAADTDFIGVAVSQRGQTVAVQVEGYVEAGATVSGLSYGWCGLICDEIGKVIDRGDSAPKKYLVVKLDSSNSIVGFIL